MQAERSTFDAFLLDAYVQEYRGFVTQHLMTTAVISLLLWAFWTPAVALLYGSVTSAAYVGLSETVRRASKAQNPQRGLAVLKLGSGVAMTLVSLSVSLLGLYLRLSTPLIQQGVLLLIGMLVFSASQPHMSRASYAGSLIWPVLSLIAVALLAGRQHHDPALVLGVFVFLAAVGGMTARQGWSNRRLIALRASLSVKNAELNTALEDAEAHRAEAVAASQAKSNFLAVTSHEIRTPLNAVLGLGEGLRREASTPRERELAEGVVEAGGMLLRLLNAVLDLSQIEQGRMQLKPVAVDVRQALRAIGALWSTRIEERGLRLELEFTGEPEAFEVLVDLGKLEQTVINLVSNAVKFTAAGDIRLVADASLADGRSHLRIEVQDRGPGLAEADRERVFAPFEQTDFGRRAGGAGLGLAIAKAIVQMMGGAIGVSPRQGGGSVFWLSLELPTAKATPLVGHQPQALGGRLRILAAEDNAANREVLKVLLAPVSAALSIVENGLEATESAARQDFDLILMDAHMPVMDGVEALRRIREDERVSGRRRMIYMFTANVFDDDVRNYLAAGADGVLKKPIDLAELQACLVHAEAAIAAVDVAPELRRVGA